MCIWREGYFHPDHQKGRRVEVIYSMGVLVVCLGGLRVVGSSAQVG